MLIEEAKWFGEKISKMDPLSVYPMLDVGSSTEKFRKVKQPWIDEYIFKPGRERKQKIIHTDIKPKKGVDIVGDLKDTTFLKKLSKMRFKSVFCANLLEHVRDRNQICKMLISIISERGHIFVSCPYKYPYHPDPIDTMFRPDISKLSSLFPEMSVKEAKIVNCGTFFDFLKRSPAVSGKNIVRLFLPFYRPRGWFIALNRVPWLFREFKVTCLILQK